MAKRPENQARGTEFIALPAGQVADAELEDDRTDEERSFDEFITGLGAEKMGELRVGKLKLAKDGSPLANARSAHCFSCPIDQFNFSELLEYIRSRHGAGLYRVVGIASGRRGVAFNRIIEIAEDLGPPQSKPSQDPAQNPAALLESFSRMMAESSARTEALISRLTERQQSQPQSDPAESFMKMAALFQGMIASLVPVFQGKPAGGGDDLLGQLEKLAKIKELLGGGDGGGGAEANFYDVVKTGLQSFGPALAALAVRNAQMPTQETPALAAPPQTVIPAAAPNSNANYNKPAPGRSPTPQTDPAMANFKRQVDTLVQNAKMNVDPLQLAETIVDLTPDDKIDALGDMLDAPDMIEQMAKLNSEVNNYRPFFESLRKALLDLLEDDGADTLPAPGTQETPGPAGDAPTS